MPILAIHIKILAKTYHWGENQCATPDLLHCNSHSSYQLVLEIFFCCDSLFTLIFTPRIHIGMYYSMYWSSVGTYWHVFKTNTGLWCVLASIEVFIVQVLANIFANIG